MLGSDFHLGRNTCSLAAWPLLHQFFSSPFVFSEINLITTSRRTAHLYFAAEIQAYKLPENSVPRLHKAQYRNWHYGCEVVKCTHAAEKHTFKLGIFWPGKQTAKHVQKYLWSWWCCFHILKMLMYKMLPNRKVWESLGVFNWSIPQHFWQQ